MGAVSSQYSFLESLNNDNIDNLSCFGSKAQSSLVVFSRTVSGLVNREEEDRVEELLKSIEAFPGLSTSEKTGSGSGSGGFLSRLFGGGARGRTGSDRNSDGKLQTYDDLIRATDELKISLQLQQAGLIKDNFILDEMARTVEAAGHELEVLIEAGEAWLGEQKNPLNKTELDSGQWSFNGKEQENQLDRALGSDLITRVEKRVEDLRISRMIALQSLEQTKLMQENNRSLIEKSRSAVSNVIPLWQNQAAIMKSLEKMKAENLRLTDMLTDLSSAKAADRNIKNKIIELINSEV